MEWFGFFIMMSVLIVCQHIQYMNGHDTAFFGHKTEHELRIREAVTAKQEKSK